MNLDVRSAKFWDEAETAAEMQRCFDVCHGCRLCFNLCPVFPALFNRIDAEDGEVSRLTGKDFADLTDLCYQCKLCFPKCPYTPPHEFNIDLPHVFLRARAVKTRRNGGVSPTDRLMGDPDKLGRLASKTARLTNWASRNPGHRILMEKALGIHRDCKLPAFSPVSFASWFHARGRPPAPAPADAPKPAAGERVVLFHTCFVNHNNPEVGKAAVRVLERSGVEVLLPDQRCCGMPHLDGGDIEAAVESARANVASLAPLVEGGCSVVVPGPTCSYMIKFEYPDLVGTEAARLVASRTFDLCEYLMALNRAKKLDLHFAGAKGKRKLAYHLPCHLKAQNLGYKSKDLLELVPGIEVEAIEKCAGIDGTWGMKARWYPLSLKVAEKLFRGLREAEAEEVVSDCPLAALQIENGAGLKPRHPVEILAESYGSDSGS